MEIDEIRDVGRRLIEQTQRVVIGQSDALELMLVALLSEGHVLLEGVPGIAKTLLVRTFSTGLSLDFNRIQFTPDLMPGDVLGTNLFDFQKNHFVLTKGPIFTETLLADEINRTPPKTQAALLEAMQERSVTIDGRTYDLGRGFMVIATQNPIEQEGTYPLPEAQLDRFLFKVQMSYPGRDEEIRMVALHGNRSSHTRLSQFDLEPLVDTNFLDDARATIAELRMADDMVTYVVDLIRATREHPSLICGGSPRSTNTLASAARARAALDGRDFVIADDIKQLALPVLRHRVVLAPGAEIDGSTPESVVHEVVDRIPAPR